MFNAVKDVDKFALASVGIFSRLCSVSNRSYDRKMQETDRKENADPREDYTCRWECLTINIKADNPRDEMS
jgi:hypothetical protein